MYMIRVLSFPDNIMCKILLIIAFYFQKNTSMQEPYSLQAKFVSSVKSDSQQPQQSTDLCNNSTAAIQLQPLQV